MLFVFINIFFFLENGKVYAWGNNEHDQLGIAREESKEINKPVIVSSLSSCRVKQVICGYRHSAFITGSFIINIFCVV